jgi:thiol-disulfide isomerase/thioredoxin
LKKNIFYIILIIGLVAFYWWRYRVAPTVAFETVQVQELAGNMVNLSEKIKGPTVVHFYASWCGPCLAEMRELSVLIPTTDLKKLNYIFITDDSFEKIEKIKDQMPSQIQFYKVNSLKDLKIYTIPTTYFINSKGEVVLEQVNPCNWSDSNFQEDIFLLTK